MAGETPTVDPQLLEILRCPVAVQAAQNKDAGEDPGRLRLVRDYWLVSDDSGYKYPIHNGIPVMLIPEGERWKDTSEDELPVPPPELESNPVDQI